MNEKMNDRVKTGIAIATLVGIVVLIVLDRSNAKHEEAPPRTPDTVTLVNSTPAPVPLPAVRHPEPANPVAAAPVRPEATRPSGAPRGECPDLTVVPKPADAAPAAPVAPAAAVKTPPAPVRPPVLETLPGGRRLYTVVPGDTLYGISVKIFNTPRHYEQIYEANRERIEDPNTLQIGLKLVIPDVTSKPTSSRAVPPTETATAREEGAAPSAHPAAAPK